MARVLTSSLTPGMKLRRPLLNKGGVTVLPEGIELTEGLIEKIMTMGIEAADVQGKAPSLPGRAEALAQLDARFRKVETAPHMDVLKRLLREHLEAVCGSDGP